MDTVAEVVAWLAQQGVEAYLVGGCVRDRLLGRATYDLDVAVAGPALRLARRLADAFRGSYYPLDEARGTGRAILPAGGSRHLVVDLAMLRGPDLASDLLDRDFTINALAASVRSPQQIIDLCQGRSDLEAGMVRPVSAGSIRNDPLRAVRAFRLAAELGFRLAPETEALILQDGGGLSRVSGERVRDEVARLLALERGASSLQAMDRLGLLALIFPELEPLRGLAQPPPHTRDALQHSLLTVHALEDLLTSLPALPQPERIRLHLLRKLGDLRPRLVTLKLAALLHDIGKPHTLAQEADGQTRFIGHERIGAEAAATALRRLRFAGSEIRLCGTIVANHMRPLLLAREPQVSARATYRFFRQTGEAGVEVLLHSLADQRATYGDSGGTEVEQKLLALVVRMLSEYWEQESRSAARAPLVTGHDLMRELDLGPGRDVGRLLSALHEAQAIGEIVTREQAIALARSLLASDDTSQQ